MMSHETGPMGILGLGWRRGPEGGGMVESELHTIESD